MIAFPVMSFAKPKLEKIIDERPDDLLKTMREVHAELGAAIKSYEDRA